MKKLIMFIAGFVLIAFGLSMVFKNWPVLAAMFKAFAGVGLTLAGLVMMFAASLRR